MTDSGPVRSGTTQGPRRIAAGAIGVMALVAATAGLAVAGGLPPPPVLPFPPDGNPGGGGMDKVRFATTGNQSELVESIPITRTPGDDEELAMSIDPDRLPTFDAGDSLDVQAEVQPSSTCVVPESRCVGRRYRINPFIRTRLVLADAADPDAAAIELAKPRVVHCVQRRPNRNHHCAIVFRDADLDIPDPNALPCPPDACYINLLVGADHPKAKPGNRIVLGGDRPGGSVAQDKGRISAVIVRANAPDPTFAVDGAIRAGGLRLHPRPGGSRKRVVHSIEVPELHDGEVLEATATFRAKIPSGRKGSGGQRRRKRHAFNVFIGTDLIFADSPTAIEPTHVARTAGLRGELAEGNGFNCTQRPSGYRSPCFVEKAGAIRVRNDVSAPLYINLVSRAKPKLKIARKRDKVKLRAEAGLRAVRFSPQ